MARGIGCTQCCLVLTICLNVQSAQLEVVTCLAGSVQRPVLRLLAVRGEEADDCRR